MLICIIFIVKVDIAALEDKIIQSGSFLSHTMVFVMAVAWVVYALDVHCWWRDYVFHWVFSFQLSNHVMHFTFFPFFS